MSSFGLILGLLATAAPASPSTERLGLRDAVLRALAQHPHLESVRTAVLLRSAEVERARSGYLPEVDLSLQLERGTGNVLRGALFGMKNVPAVSGPPTGRNLDEGGFGSAIAAGASWDLIGLLVRVAEVDAALAAERQSKASGEAERLAIGFLAADRFLALVAEGETVRAASASVDRAGVFLGIVKTLVGTELRPGADESRARAELAIASTQLIRAQQTEAVGRTQLAEALGAPGRNVAPIAGRLLELPSIPALHDAAAPHPRLIEAEAAVRAAAARRATVSLQYLPRLDLVAALWLRGTGLNSGALETSPGAGLLPDTPNWATGLVLTWPVLDLITVRAKDRVEAARVALEDAHQKEIAQAIETEIGSARAILEGAWRVAQNTPIALQAATAAHLQATARYRSGLAGVDEVAQAEKLLTQAEIDDALARLGVHKAKLVLAYAIGDLALFLDELDPPGGAAR